MKFFEILLESRVDDFKQKYTQKFGADNVNRIASLFEPKYLNWVGAILDQVNFDENLRKLKAGVDKFDKVSTNLPQTDLYQYKSATDLFSAIEEYEGKVRREVKETQGGNVVYDDGRFFVVNPMTHESSCYYGRGTKWCTAASSEANFKKYNEDGKLFYVIDKALPTSNPYYKVAILEKFDGDTSFWDAQDSAFSNGWILDTDKFKEIENSISNYMETFYKDQVEKFREIAKQRREREKAERLRIQREKQLKLSVAEERRLNNEWDLSNSDIDEEGLKANALLQYLESEGEDVMTKEDQERLRVIDAEIERLNQEYNDAENPEVDLLDEISELEDEKDEISKKLNLYSLIPMNYGHYDMTGFEIIQGSLEGNEYAVGTESELESSAHDYVEQLLDDVGYEGFNKGFVEQFLDEDQVADTARDDYEYDVNENPEVYLDEDDRELSSGQVDEIRLLERKNQQLQQQILAYESMMEETEDEDLLDKYQEKIDDLQDLITDNEVEIDDIKSSPAGDYNEQKIEEKIEDLVEEVRRDPESYMNDRGLNFSDFIDKDKFIQGVIDSDGYGMINGYDGSYDEQKVGDTWYYVMRIN